MGRSAMVRRTVGLAIAARELHGCAVPRLPQPSTAVCVAPCERLQLPRNASARSGAASRDPLLVLGPSVHRMPHRNNRICARTGVLCVRGRCTGHMYPYGALDETHARTHEKSTVEWGWCRRVLQQQGYSGTARQWGGRLGPLDCLVLPLEGMVEISYCRFKVRNLFLEVVQECRVHEVLLNGQREHAQRESL